MEEKTNRKVGGIGRHDIHYLVSLVMINGHQNKTGFKLKKTKIKSQGSVSIAIDCAKSGSQKGF